MTSLAEGYGCYALIIATAHTASFIEQSHGANVNIHIYRHDVSCITDLTLLTMWTIPLSTCQWSSPSSASGGNTLGVCSDRDQAITVYGDFYSSDTYQY